MTKGIHTLYITGYKEWEIEAERRHRGGIYILCIEEAGWKVE